MSNIPQPLRAKLEKLAFEFERDSATCSINAIDAFSNNDHKSERGYDWMASVWNRAAEALRKVIGE